MNYPTNDQLQEISFNANNIPNAIKLTVDLFKQLNPDPVKPERPCFPGWATYAAKDNLTDSWYLYENKPIEYDVTDDEWNFIDGKVSNDFLNTNQILWLEHINAGRPPEESLIKLDEHK